MTEDESLPRANVNAPGEQKGAAPSKAAAKAPAASNGAGAWKRRLITVAGPLALAGAMLVYVIGQRGPNGPPLPDYTVAATGAPAGGSAVSETHLRLAKSAGRGARFELVLRPAAQPEEPVVAYAFTFSTPSSEAVPLDAKVEIAPAGAIRLTGSARALEDAREIRIVLGTPAAIGKFVDAAARAAANTTDAQVRVLSVPIDRE
ncbi:MAG: hypothetical protein BGO98_09745 [Myxococcales bacterium 68-20]|nr:hypothetical protein [Myxococcales bacterium]OJY17947.1 MAG: hypothetical protein BGO98_09745 [Myxococcales bacterium 68-20]